MCRVQCTYDYVTWRATGCARGLQISRGGPCPPTHGKPCRKPACFFFFLNTRPPPEIPPLPPPAPLPFSPQAPRAPATRWRAGSERTLEFGAETAADCHVVKIVLRTMNICFSVSGRTVQDGVTTPGTVHVTEPALPVRCLFRGPYDVLHLHVPNTLIAECTRDMPGHHAPVLRSEAVPRKDMI